MLKAILFDLDGTIANTDPLHYTIWREMLLNYGIEIDETFYKARISGRQNPEILKDILPNLSADLVEKFAYDKEAIFRQKAVNLQPLNGFREMVDWTKKHQLKRALVTNAPKLNAKFMLEILGITSEFDTIVIGEDCLRGKPDPLPYQTALDNLGIIAEEAIALEDSATGIRAAVGAGVKTIGVTSTHAPETLKAVGAFMTIPDFTDLQLWSLLQSNFLFTSSIIE